MYELWELLPTLLQIFFSLALMVFSHACDDYQSAKVITLKRSPELSSMQLFPLKQSDLHTVATLISLKSNFCILNLMRPPDSGFSFPLLLLGNFPQAVRWDVCSTYLVYFPFSQGSLPYSPCFAIPENLYFISFVLFYL